MLTVYLFVLFLLAYSWLISPAKRPAPALATVIDYGTTLEPQPQLPISTNQSQISTVAKGMPVDELVITAEELEALLPIAEEPKPIQQFSDSEPQETIAPNYSEMSTHQLRQACQERGIRYRWRKGGKNRYLSQEEMRAALLGL